MIPTNNDFEKIRQSIETASGLDTELTQRCGELIRAGHFDEAVSKAFVLLEERLRSAGGKEGMTGVHLANHLFAADGPLAARIGRNLSEREGVRELFSGAFKLLRNPVVHGAVGYPAAEAKSILGLVNLLLILLARTSEMPVIDSFPANLEAAFSAAKSAHGAVIADRLRTFVTRCVALGLKPRANATQWTSLRRYASLQIDKPPRTKSSLVTVLYVVNDRQTGLYFPVHQYWSAIVGVDLSSLAQSLQALGFSPEGKYQDYRLNLSPGLDQTYFSRLYDFVVHVSELFEATLVLK